MTPSISAAKLDQPFTGWEELRPAGATWKIEKQERNDDKFAAFFPGQNGRVYDQMLHNLPVMLHCMDGTGRIMCVNRQWSHALGHLPAEVEGRAFNELLSPESRSRLVQSVYPDYLQTGLCRNEPVDIARADGSRITVLLSMTAYRGDRGRIERSVCMLSEPASISVTTAPAKLSVTEDRRFKGAFQSAAHGMALVSPLGQIMLGNAAFWEFLGRPEGDMGSFDEFLMEADRGPFLAAMAKLLKGDMPALHQDLRFLRGDGQAVFGSACVSLIRNEAGEIEQLIVQIVDITGKMQVEQQLQRAQKMEAIGQITGGLAHDFNNLLTVVIGNLELLGARLIQDERATRRLEEAIGAARKGSGLTRQMLAFARKQVLEPRVVAVNELVNGIAPLVERSIGENNQLKVLAMDGEPKALIDPTQLESAILNLAINARDAMPDTGTLTIETQPVYLDDSYAAKFPEVTPGHYVLVAVSDTGTGMAPEIADKIFQPFFSTKGLGKGSGLGLSMVYGFIKQSGGHINVYSEVGHGTAIKMYLPRKFAEGEVRPMIAGAAEQEAAGPPTVEEAPKPRALKVLVVEDQEAVRAVACGFLTDFGYDTIEAQDGYQALAKIEEHADIDLMFTDVVMPGGMNGFDLAQAARGIRPGLRIVHTSGYAKGAMVHEEEPRLKDGFLIMKPYRREELQKIVSEALAKPI